MNLPALPRVLVTSNNAPAPGIDLLRTKCDVTIIPVPVSTREQVLQALPGQDAVFLVSHHVVNSEFLDIAGPNLKIVSTMSAGYDHLDVLEIKKRGIKVGHTPMVLSAAVAEITVLLMLSAARRAHEGRTKLEQGEAKFSQSQWMLGQDLRGSTVGIFGLGNIGQAIVKRLIGFEVGRFIYTGHSRKKAGDELGAMFVSLDELLEQSDFLVVAAPLTNETRGLFNDSAFDKMKKTAIFVNVARGQIVNTDSLVRALRNKIFAAGLDVTDPEPLPPEHELLKLPNVEIVPHLGSATIKTRNDMSIIAAQNILNGLDGKSLVYSL